MAFDTLADFLAMGRHGFFVWTAYGLTALIIFWNLWQPHTGRRRWLKEQAQRSRRDHFEDNL